MKKYKQFFLQTILLMIITPMIFIILGLLFANKLVGRGFIQYGESQVIQNWYKIKKDYIKKNKGSKIVFISGSNSLFGLNTQNIEKILKRPVLNYGTHAGLVNYIFFDSKKILNKGDIVILPLEFNYYDKKYSREIISTTVIEYTISYDKDYYKILSLKNKLKIFAYLLKIKTLMTIGKKADEQFTLNKNGDIIDVIGNDEKYINTHPSGSEINFQVDLNNIEQSELYKFIKWCKKNDIKVYAMSPNIHHLKSVNNKEKDFFEQIYKFYRFCDVKMLDHFEDGFFENKYIYNTEYHLNSDGQKVRTEYIIKLLKKTI